MFLIVRKKYKRRIQILKEIEELRREQICLEHYLGVEKQDDPEMMARHKEIYDLIDELQHEIVWSQKF